MRHGRLLILGNGGAALCAARAARASGYSGEVHLVSDVEGPAFIPMLAPYFLKGALPWERCFPFGTGFYGSLDITCHFGSPVESLDASKREVTLANGERIPYDRCLVATGARPAVPPVPGLKPSARTFVLRTAVSAQTMEEAIRGARRAVVLGASFVGLKVAEVLARRHVGVVLLDWADQVLPGGAHAACAAAVQGLFERHGVGIRLGCAMEGMEGAPKGVVCHFADGVMEEADLVVVCTGVEANIDFLDPTHVRTDRAALANERMETSAQGLYAAGDASEGINVLSGRHEWLATWENACLQGRVAGRNMAGESASYPGALPQNIAPFFEWTYAQIGDVRSSGDSIVHCSFGSSAEGRFLVLAFRTDVLVGANLINCAHLAGRLRRAILQGWRWEGSAHYGLTMDGVERALTAAADDFCYPRAFSAPWNGRAPVAFAGKEMAHHG